jgi:hypothetical protein
MPHRVSNSHVAAKHKSQRHIATLQFPIGSCRQHGSRILAQGRHWCWPHLKRKMASEWNYLFWARGISPGLMNSVQICSEWNAENVVCAKTCSIDLLVHKCDLLVSNIQNGLFEYSIVYRQWNSTVMLKYTGSRIQVGKMLPSIFNKLQQKP